ADAFRGQFPELRVDPSGVLEQLLGSIAAEPILEDLEVSCLRHVADRDLVRPEGAFDWLPVNLLGPRPPLWSFEHDHRPGRPSGQAGLTSLSLNLFDLLENL